MIYTSEKSLRENGDKIEKAIHDDIEEKIQIMKKAKEGESSAEIQQAETALMQALSKIGEALYKKSSDPNATNEHPNNTNDSDKKQDDNIKDAEHKDVE